MKNIANKKLKNFLHIAFITIKKNKLYKKIKKMKLIIKIIIFIFCMLRFMIATILVPPIPGGSMMLILGCVVLFPLDKVKSKVKYYVYRLRINKMYTKRLGIKHKRKRRKIAKMAPTNE